MSRLDLMPIFLGALVLGACGATKQQPPPEPPAPPQPVTQQVGPAGGVVTVTGYEGWQFALDVPADAVETTAITVTPLPDLPGFDFGEQVVAALRLEPDGLRFSQPVTLTISPPAGTPLPARPAAFSVSDAGTELLPALPRDGGADVSVQHFSDVALVDVDARAFQKATEQAMDLFRRFMDWTGAYASRDYDYFARPGSPFDHVPTCADALSVMNQALGLVRMFDVLGDDVHAAQVEAQLGMVLGVMVDGYGGANVVCGETGDDRLVMQCAGAAEQLAEVTGLEFGIPQRCGASSIVATPDHVQLDRGQNATVTFTVLDAAGQVIPHRPLRVTRLPGLGSPGAVTLGQLVLSSVDVGCADYGWAALLVNDELANRYGYTQMETQVPVICSPSGISMTPGRAVLIGGDHVTFQVALLDAQGHEVPLGPPLKFVWESTTPVWVEVKPDPTNSARASVGRPAGGDFVGSTTIRACFDELYPCELCV